MSATISASSGPCSTAVIGRIFWSLNDFYWLAMRVNRQHNGDTQTPVVLRVVGERSQKIVTTSSPGAVVPPARDQVTVFRLGPDQCRVFR